MIKFGQLYTPYKNYANANQNYKDNKTEDNQDITPQPPVKTEQNENKYPVAQVITEQGTDNDCRTYPKDGGISLAEYIINEKDTSTVGNIVAYLGAYESLYGVRPTENEDSNNQDTREIYYLAGLRAYGITDPQIINTYFDNRGMQVLKNGQQEGYSLKNDITINGKPIRTIDELIKALGINK